MSDSSDGLDDMARHISVTPGERRYLRHVATGHSDTDISALEQVTVQAVQSALRRFRDRTGLTRRALVAWVVRHEPCCISISSPSEAD
jgi:DNA-binding CsgD family transcriptional regulator